MKALDRIMRVSMAAFAAAMPEPINTTPVATLVHQSRSRSRGRKNPPGTKLARLAANGRVGIR